MSFILDALKKSEAERQDQAGGEFSSVPVGSDPERSRLWLWLLGGLLAINLAVLVGILLRPNVQPSPIEPVIGAPGTPPPAEQQAPVAEPAASFADRVASVRQNQAQPAATVSSASAEPATEAQAQAAVSAPSAPPPAPSPVPSIDELRLDGSLELPELHVDIHVYSDDPAERFVFINMVKHREGTTLAEGPVVRKITADGAVLEYRGRSFLLPRE